MAAPDDEEQKRPQQVFDVLFIGRGARHRQNRPHGGSNGRRGKPTAVIAFGQFVNQRPHLKKPPLVAQKRQDHRIVPVGIAPRITVQIMGLGMGIQVFETTRLTKGIGQ